jgi:integrase
LIDARRAAAPADAGGAVVTAETDRIRDTLLQRWDTGRDATRDAAQVVFDGPGRLRLRRAAVNRKVNLPRVQQARRRYLTHAQVHRLADETCSPRAGSRLPYREREIMASYRVVVLVLAYCGLRRGELAALKVKRVDLCRRRIEVAESVVEVDGVLMWGVPKGYERRSVPIPAFIAEDLRQQLADRRPEDLVFTGLRAGGVLRNRVFRRARFDRAAAALGLEGLVPHGLRHTTASLAVSSGANVKAVQRMLGHASAP